MRLKTFAKVGWHMRLNAEQGTVVIPDPSGQGLLKNISQKCLKHWNAVVNVDNATLASMSGKTPTNT